jgi:predicted AAA+ superfamily ATPase
MLPPTARLPDVHRLIDQQSYFVIHGPRQSGKTTAMLELARQLTEAGRYAGLTVSMEVEAPFSEDPGAAESAILED